MPSPKIQHILNTNKMLKDRKEPWLTHFQLIGEYIMTRKQNFTEVNERGAFLTRDLFDNTAAKANDVMSSALLGSLWPNGAKTFQLVRTRDIEDTVQTKDYYIFVTDELRSIMDDARAGLTISLDECERDLGAFGTSGIGIFDNPKGPLSIRYKAWDVKSMGIAENENGFVDTIYNEREITIRKAVKEYGLKNLSTKSQELFKNGKELDLIKVLHAIEPRMESDPFKFGNKDMPIASIHIELKANKILRESGFEEMPVSVVRFRKAMGEVFGRSPGMAALPDIIELNALWEAVTLATEKSLDPPLGVLSDGDLGPTIIDTSAGAINVFNISGRAGQQQQPIFPLFTIGEFSHVEKLIDKLVQAISDHFFIDRLLDLNNDTRMTFGEAQIRNELRGASLGTIFSRQEAELFSPLISRSFNLLFKQGRLGVIAGSPEEKSILKKGLTPRIIPKSISDAMIAGKDVFKIKYVSPAKRAMQAEEVQGILATWNLVITKAQVAPTMVDKLELDFHVRRLSELTGAPEEGIRALKAVEDLRKLRQAALEQEAQREALRAGSETMRNLGQAKASIDNSGKGQ